MDIEQKEASLSKLASMLDLNVHLPDYVFTRAWSYFRFFQSDKIFCSNFVIILKSLISSEGSDVACIAKLDSIKNECENSNNSNEVFFVDSNTKGTSYSHRLFNGEMGWIYGMERFGCTSNVGDWCIYCEKDNDIAIICMNGDDSAKDYKFALEKLNLIQMRKYAFDKPIFPFNKLTNDWIKSLGDNYT